MHVEEAEFETESAKISFIHKITEEWLLLSAKREEKQILQKAISNQRKTIEYYRQLMDAGLDDNVTYKRQNVIYDQLILEQSGLLREIETAKIGLSSLIGCPLHLEFPDIQNLSQIKLPSLPKVFPTDALKERPDVKAKEAKLRENLLLEKVLNMIYTRL